ncbi:MAG TPA: DUF2167 domain-containing protein [Dongiaceae bacterium]|nr:DUF2167 domain-containing protein [Dongiaceae bacterium]
MSRSGSLVLGVSALVLVAMPGVNAQRPGSAPRLDLIRGPTHAPLGSVALLGVPAGYVFLDANNTGRLLKSRAEPVSGHEVGFLTTTNQTWSVLFIFNQSGYVKDDEQNKLDARQLLESVKQGAVLGNKQRQRQGNPPVEVVEWELPPRYDAARHSLEWAIRGLCAGRPVVNYNARLLGRKGVIEAILIVAPERLAETLPVFRKVLADCAYQPGQTYADYRAGDRVASYGLGALVVSGAAVGAAKSGFLARAAALFGNAWTLIVVVVVGGAFAAGAAFLRKAASQRTQRAKKGPRRN